MTSASPSTRTMACNSEGTRLMNVSVSVAARSCPRVGGPGVRLQNKLSALRFHIIRLRAVPACDALLPSRHSPHFIDPHELHKLVPPRLVGRDDSFRAQILQHAFVGVVGRP